MPGTDSNYKEGNVTFNIGSSNAIIPFKFYSPDEALIDYEDHFKNNGTAFVTTT
jgi:hypothetical protein